MSTLDRAKDEAQRIANEMRSGAEKARSNIETSFKQSTDKPYSYTKLTQQSRLGQLIALPLQALLLYTESHRVGLISFLVPLTFICANAYLVFNKWQKSTDGRVEVQNFLNSRNNQQKAQNAIQFLGPFILALLVHTLSPVFPSTIIAMLFSLTDYALLAATFGCLFLDCFETLKNKLH